MIHPQHVPFGCGFPQSKISVARTRLRAQHRGSPALRRSHIKGL